MKIYTTFLLRSLTIIIMSSNYALSQDLTNRILVRLQDATDQVDNMKEIIVRQEGIIANQSALIDQQAIIIRELLHALQENLTGELY